MIVVRDVSKSYGGRPVLRPTTMEFARGRTTVLIGPSGCGKSTLLRIIVGLVTPDTGGVTIDGEALTPDTALALRRRLGYVIQDGGLFPHLTGRDNVALLARQMGRDGSWIRNRVDELADVVRLPPDTLDRHPGALSGGQRQRLGIMRALMLDPAVILLDEPLGALDPLVRYDLQEDLRRIFQNLGKTVILVTHDMGEAGFFGDDVALLGGGTVIQRGTLHDLITRPADDSVRRFIMAHRLPGVAPIGGGT
ncbi:MAG: ATP-binding cassette domain-containing protein [Planctomycetia bacterium]|nr:ATP-binding cassette domain-containing protein [Planctomycetia bacterium]